MHPWFIHLAVIDGYTEHVTSDEFSYQRAENARYTRSMVWLILLFSGSLTIPVLELQIDKCMLFLYFLSHFSGKLFYKERMSK